MLLLFLSDIDIWYLLLVRMKMLVIEQSVDYLLTSEGTVTYSNFYVFFLSSVHWQVVPLGIEVRIVKR